MSGSRRGGLRRNPLDAVIPDPSAPSAEVAQEPSAPTASAPQESQGQPVQESAPAKTPAPDKPVKFNGYVSPEHADRARDALYVLPGEWTTGRFLEHAIDLALEDLAKQYNGGKPFAKRPEGKGLRRGPRIT